MQQLSLNVFNDSSAIANEANQFFLRKRSWSATKHRVVLRYLQSFCFNLGGTGKGKSKYLNYVDGFAGAGQYDEGIGIEDYINSSNFWKRYGSVFLDTDGSPLIALKMARIFEEESRVGLRCFFSEANHKNFKKLEDSCRPFDSTIKPVLYRSAFSSILPDILKNLDGYPTLFFLDTFGVKDLAFEEILRLSRYVSTYRGELFLLFHNISVARHAGQSTAKSDNPRMLKAADTYSNNLTSLLGPNSESIWKPKWLELQKEEQGFEKWALDYFIDRLQAETPFKGVAAFPIKEQYSDPRPQYHIVVCSNHPKKAMGAFLNEIVYQEEKFLFYESDKDGLIRNFLENEWKREEARRINTSREIVKRWMRENGKTWITVEDALESMISDIILNSKSIGFLGRPSYRKIVYELCSSGFLQVRELGRGNKPVGKSRIRFIS